MEIIGLILGFLVAIIIHEVSHAWMAVRLGDPTPKLMGRLSLNPAVHYDPIGTTLLIVTTFLAFVTNYPVIPFGWAKPVQFDPYNLQNPRRDAALISLAGPVSNIVVATVLSVILRLLSSPFSPYGFLNTLIVPIIILNVVLAIFNLLPIHPLDGGKILVGILPEKDAYKVDVFLRQYGMLLLLFLIFPTFGGSSPVSLIILPLLRIILGVLLPASPF